MLAAGPGIRYAELAVTLRAAGMDVVLAVPPHEPEAARHAEAVWDEASVDRLARGFDAVVVPQGHAELGRQVARRLPPDLPVVVDCYAPGLVEHISLTRDPSTFAGFHERGMELVGRGDLFLVANERQRLYTLGLLSGAGRLNPQTYESPPLLVVPFGVPAEPPPESAGPPIARGRLVPDDAPLALWYGGVYPWFDATTAVRGFARALERVPEARLVIVGGRHPRAHAPEAELVRALDEARLLGIEERVLEAPWGPYGERARWYADADCAICLHHAGLETDLAHRTRLADLLWGRVPFVCSHGDAVGELAAAEGAAIAVPVGDAGAAADALVVLLDDPARRASCRAAAARLADDLAWPRVLAPLAEWLREPRVAADRFVGDGWRPALRALVQAAIDARRG
jgi:glycosyltransferase involved in cell wall biosynthesis